MSRWRRHRRWWLLAIAFAAVVVIVAAYGFGETYWTQVKQYEFTSPDVPAEFDGTRIVLVTDIHRSHWFSQQRVGSLVRRVNALGPDLIILGGDYVYKDTAWAPSCFAELKNLRAPLGVFGVLGNHDYGDYKNGRGDPAPVTQAMQGAGISLLRDSGVWIQKGGGRIRVGGVSDSKADRPQPGGAVGTAGPSDFVLLVSHEPDLAESLAPGAVDLVLSGHTHGGQVTFFGLFAFHVPSDYGQKYRTGMVGNGKNTVVVSNGVGTSTAPFRFFARPQIVVITLHRGNPQP